MKARASGARYESGFVARATAELCEARLVGVDGDFMLLELPGARLLSFPIEDAATAEACQALLSRGGAVVVLEMRAGVPLKVCAVEPVGEVSPGSKAG